MNRDRRIALGLGLIALATIVAGLCLGGNPASARRERRDQKRIESLSLAQSVAEMHFRTTGTVPTSTTAFEQARNINLRGTSPTPPRDLWPEYTFVSGTRYTLCTTFEEASSEGYGQSIAKPITLGGEEAPNFWDHASGKACYTITVPAFVQEEVARIKGQTSSTHP